MASRDGIGSDGCALIGNTPMVYLNKVSKGCAAKIAVKLEWLNPSGSVKDRIGVAMIDAAEKEGRIKPGISTIIEQTAGNTGIALASVAAIRGYRFIAVMSSSKTIERRTVLRALGAELVLTDPKLGFNGAVERTEQLARAIPNSFIPMQFCNEANPEIHYRTTGPEIWHQTQGKVDICVFGVGTGGTMTGVGRYLREKNPNITFYAGGECRAQWMPTRRCTASNPRHRHGHSARRVGHAHVQKRRRNCASSLGRRNCNGTTDGGGGGPFVWQGWDSSLDAKDVLGIWLSSLEIKNVLGCQGRPWK
ncbi:hypothetical protein niasHT_008793 [Heterodera trifolii]|uniref:Tryptophan synthase beta chain-like PALP domain-containing protein n=1 Tax=Heterodera trifolii TaxID=157864 RepID=A0ABD2M5T1_9BILA